MRDYSSTALMVATAAVDQVLSSFVIVEFEKVTFGYCMNGFELTHHCSFVRLIYFGSYLASMVVGRHFSGQTRDLVAGLGC